MEKRLLISRYDRHEKPSKRNSSTHCQCVMEESKRLLLEHGCKNSEQTLLDEWTYTGRKQPPDDIIKCMPKKRKLDDILRFNSSFAENSKRLKWFKRKTGITLGKKWEIAKGYVMGEESFDSILHKLGNNNHVV